MLKCVIDQIFVCINTIHVVRKIFDILCHSYQLYSIALFKDLRIFFVCYPENHIESQDCLSSDKWPPHEFVNKETKPFICPLFPHKKSWEFSGKEEYDTLIRHWKMLFQASDLKRKSFLELTDTKHKFLTPYIKGGLWLKHIEHSNPLCACITRLIMLL